MKPKPRRVQGKSMRSTVLLLVLMDLGCAAATSPHPLAPLTASEIQSATAILRASGHIRNNARFSLIVLDEPSKEMVLRGANVPRRALAVIYDRNTNQTFEAIADLSTEKVASWKEIPGAQPA